MSVLEACINLFRRSSDTSSVWGKAAGLPRPTIVPPMARSHSGDGGLPGGPGTLMPPALKHQLSQQRQQQPLRSSPQSEQPQHPSAARILPMNGGRGGVGVRGGGPPITTGNGLLRNSSGMAGNPSSFRSSPSSSSLDSRSGAAVAAPPGWGIDDGGRGMQGGVGGSGTSARWRGDGGGASINGSDGGGDGGGNADQHLSHVDTVPLPSSSPPPPPPPPSRFVLARGGGGSGDGRGDESGGCLVGGDGAGGGMAWEFKESRLGWEQHNVGTGGPGRGSDGGMDNGSSTAGSAWNNIGLSGDSGGGGGREIRVGNMRPADNDSESATAAMMNGGSSFALDGRGSWGAGGDACKRDGEGRGLTGGAADAGANGSTDGRSAGRTNALEYTGSRHHQGNGGGDIRGGEANGAGSNGTASSNSSNSSGSSSSKGGLGLEGMQALRMSLADSIAGESFRQETATSAAVSAAAVAHLHQRDGNGNVGNGSAGTGSVHPQHHSGSSESGLGVPSSSASSTAVTGGVGGYLHENGVGGGGVLSPFKFASTASGKSATSVSSPATFNSTTSSTGSGGDGSAGMAPLATISAAATAAAAAAAAADADRDCVAGRQVGRGGSGTTTIAGGGGGREEEERCKMCWMG